MPRLYRQSEADKSSSTDENGQPFAAINGASHDSKTSSGIVGKNSRGHVALDPFIILGFRLRSFLIPPK